MHGECTRDTDVTAITALISKSFGAGAFELSFDFRTCELAALVLTACPCSRACALSVGRFRRPFPSCSLPGTPPRVNEGTRWNFADRYSLSRCTRSSRDRDIHGIHVTLRTRRLSRFSLRSNIRAPLSKAVRSTICFTTGVETVFQRGQWLSGLLSNSYNDGFVLFRVQ